MSVHMRCLTRTALTQQHCQVRSPGQARPLHSLHHSRTNRCFMGRAQVLVHASIPSSTNHVRP